MLYSVRMRAAQGGAHEAGGRHISGAERLVGHELLTSTAAAMIRRALSHSRGAADYINFTVETVLTENLREANCLPIMSVEVPDAARGRSAALAALIQGGVTPAAAAAGIEKLACLTGSMRGAMLIDAQTGERLDSFADRGVRVSRMDVVDEQAYLCWLRRQGYSGAHIREAVVLASKVMAAPGVLAELCWSDDPDYTAGYVATPAGYTRFTRLKPLGSSVGGRVFFVGKNADLEELIYYLEQQPVLVKVPAGGEARSDAVSD
ncbi:6-carboxyhexanoate--CoA ligase [Sporomusa aerivorans]|uniref:6-carboxyhexanoate--CoA ligase n=1 Tax=Sporomusa aerivorans TaxID=204936 RepID=UPI00352A8E17